MDRDDLAMGLMREDELGRRPRESSSAAYTGGEPRQSSCALRLSIPHRAVKRLGWCPWGSPVELLGKKSVIWSSAVSLVEELDEGVDFAVHLAGGVEEDFVGAAFGIEQPLVGAAGTIEGD